MANYPDTPRRVPPGLLVTAAYEFRKLAENGHGCRIGFGVVGDTMRKPCGCHYGRLADECWLAAADARKALDAAHEREDS